MSNSLPIYIELDESDINYDSEKQTVLIIFAAFAGILIIYFAVRLLLPLVSKQTEEMRLKDELDTKRNAESFVTNFHSIMGHFFGPSVSLKDIRRSPSKLIPHSFILVWVVSIIVIDNAIRSFDPATGSPIIKQPQTQCGLILFFISVLGYMLNRTYSYYKERTDTKKKVQHSSIKTDVTINIDDASFSDSQSTLSIRAPRGPRPLNTVNSNITIAPDIPVAKQEAQFDSQFNYRRRVKHIEPQFETIDFTFNNVVELVALFTEFIQLASFPLRDLFRSSQFQKSFISGQKISTNVFLTKIQSAFSFISSGLPTIDSAYLSQVQFVASWWLTITSCVVAICFALFRHALKSDRIEQHIPQSFSKWFKTVETSSWVMLPLPLISMFYLIILTAFIAPLGCLSDNSTPLWPSSSSQESLQKELIRIQQCQPIHDMNPSMNTGYCLAGFLMAFVLFTVCRTAQEPVPREGRIQYTSRSELIIKICGVIILLFYVLVPSESTTTARGVMAIFILFGMVAYTVVVGTCYSRHVNVIRTISFLCVLWMAAVVVYYTSPQQADLLYQTGSDVAGPVFIGWCLIAAIYYTGYTFLIKHLQKASQAPRDYDSSAGITPENEDMSPKGDPHDQITDNSSRTSLVPPENLLMVLSATQQKPSLHGPRQPSFSIPTNSDNRVSRSKSETSVERLSVSNATELPDRQMKVSGPRPYVV